MKLAALTASIALCLSLASCVTTHDFMTDSLNEYMNQPAEKLLKALGRPVFEDPSSDGQKITYTWYNSVKRVMLLPSEIHALSGRIGNTPISMTGTTWTPTQVSGECIIRATVNRTTGLIVDWFFRGNARGCMSFARDFQIAKYGTIVPCLMVD